MKRMMAITRRFPSVRTDGKVTNVHSKYRNTFNGFNYSLFLISLSTYSVYYLRMHISCNALFSATTRFTLFHLRVGTLQIRACSTDIAFMLMGWWRIASGPYWVGISPLRSSLQRVASIGDWWWRNCMMVWLVVVNFQLTASVVPTKPR